MSKEIWLNDNIMVPIKTSDIECTSLECSGTMTCANMTVNSYSTSSATIGSLTTNNLIMPSLTQNNALTRVLVEDPADSTIHYSTSVNSYPVTLPTTTNTLAEFTGTAGQIASSTISVTGGNQLSNVQTIVGNDPSALLKISNIQTSGISEKTGGAGVFVSSPMNYAGANFTSDPSINQVLVRDPANVNEVKYRTDFVDVFSPQDVLEKHFNAEFGSGSYFYSNSGANRKLKFNLAIATDNTSTTLRAVQTSNINVTLPNATGTLALVSQIPNNTSYVDLTTNQSVGGVKTFTSPPVISSITNGGTVTIPTGTDTLANLNGAQILQNKKLFMSNNTFVNDVDNTKIVSFLNNGSTNTGVQFTTTPTASQIIQFQDVPAGQIVVARNTTDVLSNKTISNLVATGTSQNLLSGKTQKFYVSGIQTIGNVLSVFASIPIPLNTNLMTTINILCTCVAGPDLNKSKFFSATFGGKNVGGVGTTYSIVNNSASDASFLATMNPALGVGPALNISLNGLVSDTINYSGTYEVIYP